MIFHGKLVSKKTHDIILEKTFLISGLHHCETSLRALHLLGWTHIEMGLGWWDKSINITHQLDVWLGPENRW